MCPPAPLSSPPPPTAVPLPPLCAWPVPNPAGLGQGDPARGGELQRIGPKLAPSFLASAGRTFIFNFVFETAPCFGPNGAPQGAKAGPLPRLLSRDLCRRGAGATAAAAGQVPRRPPAPATAPAGRARSYRGETPRGGGGWGGGEKEME